METSLAEPKKTVSQAIDFYKIFKVFFSRWYWILGCVIIALIVAKVQLLYTVPVYSTGASLKLQDNQSSFGGSGQMPSQGFNYTDRIQSEGYVIKSNNVIINAISNLNYKISYYSHGRIHKTEAYPNIPFKINIIKQDSVDFNHGEYEVEAVDQNEFSIINADNPKGKAENHRYGEILKMGNMQFSIVSNIPSHLKYSFKFNSKDEFVGRIMGGLNYSEAERFTNIMSLSMTDQNGVFAADALNAVMKEYISYDVIQKRRSAKQTVAFIDKQLGFIDTAAGKSGATLADFKTRNNVVDLGSSSSMTVGKLADFEKQKTMLDIELLGIKQLEDQLNSNKDKIDLNQDLDGTISVAVGSLIVDLNKLVYTRQTKLVEYNANSQPIKELNTQINSIRQAIKNNIQSLRQRNQSTRSFLNNQIFGLNQNIRQIPSKEQALVKLNTNFEVNNKVRSFLSEKKIEAEMNAAAVVPSAEIVNIAYPSTFSIQLDSSKVYTYATILGFCAGIGIILLVRFLNPYIYDKETVESLTNTPIIGVIRKFPEYIDKDSRQALSLAKPKSVFAESVRSVRTNLSFLAANKKSKTICITSEISGEGKSFVTVNLASTLALIDKKIILIAADLRKSKLHTAFGNDNKKGLSNYLAGQVALEEVITHDDLHNLDFIPSGPVPPNPSELLHTDKMKELLALLAPKYDYVLVDTAPVGLVSDAIPLIRQSDVNLFVIRSGKSQMRAAAIPERLSREYSLSNLAIVLNAFGDDALHSNYYTTDYSRGGGNSTYYYSDYSGYAGSGYYDNDPKKWWEFWKKK
jgi:tyrosine-protein kinase Etk/Wzc